MQTPEILLLGGPNSGKTHYAGQLYGRLQYNPGVLRLRKEHGAPSDLSALQEVLSCLENGNAATHTPRNTWAEVQLPLVDKQEKAFDVTWPDYAGEQLHEVFSNRSVSRSWKEVLSRANSWVLLIRLSSETTFPDALSELNTGDSSSVNIPSRADRWDANAYWVEQLQILLHVSQTSTAQEINTPRLAILLSCFDEVSKTGCTPIEALEEKLPLVASFVKANWNQNSYSVWGLSALGQELTENSNEDKFIDDGPEHQGWIMPPSGGEISTDLSLPLMWLIEGFEV